VVQLSRGRSRRQSCARITIGGWAQGVPGGHLREEAHMIAERPRLDLEEGAGVARPPVLERILLDLVDLPGPSVALG
jgi:hypothetical protein